MAAVRGRWWLALACAIVAGAAIAAYNESAVPEARVRVAFTPTNIVQAVFNEPRQDVPPPTAGELSQDEVLVDLSRDVGLPVAALRDRLRVEQTDNEREAVLVASADTDGSGTALPLDADRQAAALAHRWATVFIEYRERLMRRRLAAARREVRDRADKLLEEGGVFQRREILRSLLALEAAEKIAPDTQIVRFEGVSSQELPLSVSLLLSLLVGAGAALLLALLDGRLRTTAGVEASTGLPAVGDGAADPVARLRNQLFLSSGSSAPTITLLTGTDGRDSEAVFVLAQALGESFSTDKRRTIVLLDVMPGCAQPTVGRGSTSSAEGELAVSRIDDTSHGTPEVWEHLLEERLTEFDAVVVAAPELTSASTLGAAPRANAVVLVCTEGTTRAAAAEKAAAAAGRLRRPPTFAVLVKRSRVRQPGAQAPEGEGASLPEPQEDETAATAPRRSSMVWRGLKRRRSKVEHEPSTDS